MILEPGMFICVSRFLGDDHFKRMSRVTVGVARLTPNVQWPGMPSIGQICSPSPVMVTCINEKSLLWDDKLQTNKHPTKRDI